ncbi:chromate efflux transporter, partial [Candidatus Sumerlaeota bacterium]|nr:chromate efflux transporter [Candidatus Sumerlaeota bacterium]
MSAINDPTAATHSPEAARGHSISFREAFLYWLRLGFINFGGPAGQIAIMHKELVDERRWISEERFLHALNFCMLLPGPEAQQLAIYIGWLLHRTIGGIVAGVFFVLPAFFFIMGLSWVYAVHGNIAWIAAIFYGLRAAVMAIVAAAVLRIGSRALKHPLLIAIATAAFIGIFFLKIPFPIIVLSAGLVGLVGQRFCPEAFASQGHGAKSGATSAEPPRKTAAIADDHPAPEHTHPSAARTIRVLITGLAVWWLPLIAVAVWRGRADILSVQAVFFSKAAMVTFGGAYAVLSYLAQAAVEQYGWLRPGQMLDGLGLAESTPGPLIMVTQFVGFVGAYQNPPADLSPLTAGILGASVTVWATFAPCFLWIFLGAP